MHTQRLSKAGFGARAMSATKTLPPTPPPSQAGVSYAAVVARLYEVAPQVSQLQSSWVVVVV